MVQTDVIRTTDMQTSSTGTVNLTRFNDWKRAYAVSENDRFAVSTSTFGGTTQSLPTASSTLGAQSEFFRNKHLDFTAPTAGSAWTLEVPNEHRIFIITNNSGQTITLESTAGASPTLDIADAKTYTVGLDTTGFALLKDHIVSTGASTKPYSVGVYNEGVSGDSQQFVKFVYPRDVIISSGFPLSEGHLTTGPDAAWEGSIQFNSTQIGTVNFTSGSTTATFTSSAAYTFGAGDVLEIIGPSTADPGAKDFSFTIAGGLG